MILDFPPFFLTAFRAPFNADFITVLALLLLLIDFLVALQQNLKPLTEPLEKIVENLKSNPRKRPLTEEDSQSIDVPVVAKKSKKKKKKKNNLSVQFESALSDNLDNETVVEKKENDDESEIDLTPIVASQYLPTTSSIRSIRSGTQKKIKVDEYLDILVKNQNTNHLDTKAGFRYFKSGEYKIGDTQVYFDDSNIIVGEKKYPLTEGLADLTLKKNPTPYIVKTNQDVDNYGDIIKTTNAHKKYYKPRILT